MTDAIWIAFLRGMNLGGRRLTNDELCAAVEACGCHEVEAYQASGNVWFTDPRSREELEAALPDGFERELSYPVPVFLRSADELAVIADAAPFDDHQLAVSKGKPQVIFLHGELPSEVLDEVLELVPDGDVLVPSGRELHWLPAAGLSRSAFDLRRLDEVTGGTTIRTHGTVARLSAKVSGA